MEVTLITNENAKSPVAEAYRTIRTNLQFSKAAGSELKTIMITSPTPNEGKSTTISNLGVVMAQSGKKVCIVDCDFRNPTQHKIFKLENKGMSNAVVGETLENVIKPTGMENLWVITSGPIAPNPSELLGSDRMTELLGELKARFDYVLIDTPPIMPVTDAAVLASRMDGVIMLLESGAVSPQAAKEAKTRLEQAGAHILGAVLNKVDVAAGHYGYGGYGKNGYGYYYYYGHEEEKK